MKVVVPYTQLRDETVEALRLHTGHGDDLHFVDVSSHDEQLWELWQHLWAQAEDVVVVEHDVVIHAQVLTGFAGCGEPWCSFGYRYAHYGVYHGSGCVRFRAELMEADPRLWDRVALHRNPSHPERHWCSLDAFAQHELAGAGYRQHRHDPPVAHLGAGVSHGCA